jgi:hypothetical protein
MVKLIMLIVEIKLYFYSIHRLNHFPINFKITKYDWRIYTKNRKENIKPQI